MVISVFLKRIAVVLALFALVFYFIGHEVRASDSCAECHRDECQKWERSYHALAMDAVKPPGSLPLGDFNQFEFHHIPFDELGKLDDPALRLLIDRIKENDRFEPPVVAATGDRFLSEAIKERTELFDAMESKLFSGLRLLVLALSDTTAVNRERFLSLLTVAEKEEFDADEAFLKRCGSMLPYQSVSHSRIVELARRLVDEGKISASEGTTSVFHREGDRFFVTTGGKEDKIADFEILYSIGIYPLQQYLVAFTDGRIQTLPVAWNSTAEQWYHLYPKELLTADDPLHWTGANQNWNYMCAACHTTDYRKNYQFSTDSYNSQFEALGIGCRSCHGDCRSHEAEARKAVESTPLSRPVAPDRAVPGWEYQHSPIRLVTRSQGENIDTCAGCHARCRTIAPFNSKESFFDLYQPEKIDLPIYYPDGQLLDEAFEYGSFTQCRMFAMDVRCSNCHDPHDLSLKYEGNRLCGQCHRSDYYDNDSHHHHGNDGTLGTYCVDCHLPMTKYMVIDRRYDHNISIPRPELTLALGTPNACNRCHLDREKGKDAAWAAEIVQKWWSAEQSLQGGKIQPGEHYGYAIAAGRSGSPDGFEKLAALIEVEDERKVRPIVRAAAMELLRTYYTGSLGNTGSPAIASQVGQLFESFLTNESPHLRRAAVSGWESASNNEKISLLLPLLTDPVRSVRLEAFRVLSTVPRSAIPAESLASYDDARREYVQSQMINSDQSASWLNLGVLEMNLKTQYLKTGDAGQRQTLTDPVVTLYERGIKLDPNFFPLRINLAMLRHLRNEPAQAESEFREAIRIDPKSGQARYSLALLLAELDRKPEALDELAQAVVLLPKNHRILYNYAVALFQAGQKDGATEAINNALKIDPDNREYRNAREFFLKNK